MMPGKLLFAALLMTAVAAAFAADTRRSEIPIGLQARQAAEEALRACYVECRRHGDDASAGEACLVECNGLYPQATSLQPKRERMQRR